MWGRIVHCVVFSVSMPYGDRSGLMKIRPLRGWLSGLGKVLGPNLGLETTELPASKAQGLDSAAASWDLAGLRLDCPPCGAKHHENSWALYNPREMGGAPVITINKFLAHPENVFSLLFFFFLEQFKVHTRITGKV